MLVQNKEELEAHQANFIIELSQSGRRLETKHIMSFLGTPHIAVISYVSLSVWLHDYVGIAD